MKRIAYILLLLFIMPVVCYSQELFSTRQSYRAGDVLLKQHLSFPNVMYSDTCRFWDFSRLKPEKNDYRMVIHATGDTLFTVQEHQAAYIYEISGDTILLSSYRTATTQMDYSLKEVVLPFPFGEGSLYEGTFRGEGDYCGKMVFCTMGNVRIRGCKVGTLVLPGEDTLRQVLRVESIKKFTNRIIPKIDSIQNRSELLFQNRTDTSGMSVKTNRWYAVGSRYPVFETIESSGWMDGKAYEHFRTAFMYHPEDQYYGLATDPDNEQARVSKEISDAGEHEKVRTEKVWKYRFAKTAGQLVVDFELTKSCKIRLTVADITGVLRIAKPEHLVSEGFSRETVDLSSLPSGEYLLTIQVDGEVVGEKFIK